MTDLMRLAADVDLLVAWRPLEYSSGVSESQPPAILLLAPEVQRFLARA